VVLGRGGTDFLLLGRCLCREGRKRKMQGLSLINEDSIKGIVHNSGNDKEKLSFTGGDDS